MKISIRAALVDDKPDMWRLYESAMKPHIEAIWGWNAAWQTADFEKAFSTVSTYVIEVDGKFAGYIQIDLGPVENYLRMILLMPGFRSSGIGARLMAEILRASHRGGRNVCLRVFRTNNDAKRFYQREGWLVTADEGDFLLMRHQAHLAATSLKAARERGEQHFEMCTTLA